jgi:hypothetical protein
MAKRVEKDGKIYRVRRGKLVEIPPKWVGVFASPQTIAKRPSKAIHKLRKTLKYGDGRCHGRPDPQLRGVDASRRADGED